MSGIFGVIGDNNCTETLFYGVDYHSHLGTQYGGIAVWGKELIRKIHSIRTSQFKSKFEDEMSTLSGNMGIGVVSSIQEQPICLNSRFGSFAIVMNGFIENADQLAKGLLEMGHSFSEVRRGRINQIELVAKIINTGSDILSGIQKVFESIEGSCSMLILTEKGIYAARDRFGCSPLVLGCKDNSWAITTESGAFVNIGYEIKKYLGPGEIIYIDENGPIVKGAASKKCRICAFLISTRSVDELIARRAINELEGKKTDNINAYLDHKSEKYKRMVDWIAKDLRVTTLRYQIIDDMIEAIGLPKERLCLYCWT